MMFGQVWEYAGIFAMVLSRRGDYWDMVCLNDPPGGNLFEGVQLEQGMTFWTPDYAFRWNVIDE